MKHNEKYHVHYHYTDRNFNLKLCYLAKYMQETALAAFDRLDAPRRELIDKNLAFFLSKISFRFEGEIRKFDDIRVETWALPVKSAAYIRNYRIYNESTGVCAVRAASSWVLINMAKKTIVHPNTLSENFTAINDDEELGFGPVRRIRTPDESGLLTDESFLFEKEVFYCDIDENLHMNNTVYLDIVENALWMMTRGVLPGKLCALDLSYNKGAVEGDRLSVSGLTIAGDFGTEIYLRGMIGKSNCFIARACFGYTLDTVKAA